MGSIDSIDGVQNTQVRFFLSLLVCGATNFAQKKEIKFG
jgi:hypothetical protein